MSKRFVEIACHEPNDMPTLSVTSLVEIRWLENYGYFLVTTRTYIIGRYNPLSRYYNLGSRNTYYVDVNFVQE